MNPLPHDLLLDVGGRYSFWGPMARELRITCLNLSLPDATDGPALGQCVQGDARFLPYRDGQFDIAFSNSTIEHVGTLEDQRRFASEIRRVGRAYWVQTPNRWFPVEPHLLAPPIHYLPAHLQRTLFRHFTLRGLLTHPSKQQADDFLAHIRLLTKQEMVSLFPDGTLYEERVGPFTKSFVV